MIGDQGYLMAARAVIILWETKTFQIMVGNWNQKKCLVKTLSDHTAVLYVYSVYFEVCLEQLSAPRNLLHIWLSPFFLAWLPTVLPEMHPLS